MWAKNFPEWSWLRWLCYFSLLLAFLLPYCVFFLCCLVLTFIPIFPTRTALHNLKSRLKLGVTMQHWILAKLYANYLIYFFEAAVLRPLGFEYVAGQAELSLFLKQLAAKKNSSKWQNLAHAPASNHLATASIMFLSAHIANIEAAGEALARACTEVKLGGYVALAKPSEFKVAQLLLTWMRQFRGINLLWTNRKDLLRAMLQLINEGKSLGFLVDQKPQSGGVFVRFFGEYAAFPVAGPDLAIRYQLPVVHIVVIRRFPGIFRLRFAPGFATEQPQAACTVTQQLPNLTPAVWSKGISEKEQRVAPILATFAGWLEEIICEAPAQWFWDYRKWSRKPPEC